MLASGEQVRRVFEHSQHELGGFFVGLAEAGLEAARLMARIVAGSVRPTQAARFVPVAINSVLLGFPYADVIEMGASFIVVTDNDPNLAVELAHPLGDSFTSRRKQFVAQLIGIEEALDQADQLAGPVCLLDMGDNIGGGSCGDGTSIVRAVRRRGGPTCFACLFDPRAAEQAIAGLLNHCR